MNKNYQYLKMIAIINALLRDLLNIKLYKDWMS